MNEVRKPEATDFGASFGQASSDATRRLCEHGQSVAKTISDWNTEVSHFLSHRAARNGETMSHVAKCQNFPEILALQAQWMQGTSEDYLKGDEQADGGQQQDDGRPARVIWADRRAISRTSTFIDREGADESRKLSCSEHRCGIGVDAVQAVWSIATRA